MKITPEMMDAVIQSVNIERSRYRNQLSETDVQDLQQEVYIKLLDAPTTAPKKNERRYVGYLVWSTFKDHIRRETNRARLLEENADRVTKLTTPTVSNSLGADPAEELEAVEVLRRRWRSLSSLLKRVARRSFFGYEESPQKVARDLGMSVGAVNTARTRIKQHLLGE